MRSTNKKDSNGVEIFEGDRVVFNYSISCGFGHGESYGRIIWSESLRDWHILWENGSSDYVDEYIYCLYVLDDNGDIKDVDDGNIE
jgi:hypothetical protein